MKQLFGKFACLMLLVMALLRCCSSISMAGTGVDNLRLQAV